MEKNKPILPRVPRKLQHTNNDWEAVPRHREPHLGNVSPAHSDPEPSRHSPFEHIPLSDPEDNQRDREFPPVHGSERKKGTIDRKSAPHAKDSESSRPLPSPPLSPPPGIAPSGHQSGSSTHPKPPTTSQQNKKRRKIQEQHSGKSSDKPENKERPRR